MTNENNYSAIISNARILLPQISQLTETVPYEAKGVLYSEILFLAACLYNKKVNRILESGRARGQSTLLLAKTFPQAEIISYEFDKNSEDVKVAEERLSGYSNVTMKFGDSLKELPKIAQSDDVVIIDGPKMFIALRLALKLLIKNKVQHIFIHDLPKEDSTRRFLDSFFKEALFADYKGIANITSVLDQKIIDLIPPHNRLNGFEGDYGYGYSLSYLPYNPKRRYLMLYYLSFPYDLLTSETNIVYRCLRKVRHLIKSI